MNRAIGLLAATAIGVAIGVHAGSSDPAIPPPAPTPQPAQTVYLDAGSVDIEFEGEDGWVEAMPYAPELTVLYPGRDWSQCMVHIVEFEIFCNDGFEGTF